MEVTVKVVSANAFVEKGRVVSVNLTLDKVIDVFRDGQVGDSLDKTRFATKDNKISFLVSSLMAQLTQLNAKIAELRDIDYLTAEDYRHVLRNATLGLRTDVVKAGDIKKDYAGDVIPARNADGSVMLDDSLNVIPAHHEHDACIKTVTAVTLTEKAIEYINHQIDARQRRANETDDAVASGIRAVEVAKAQLRALGIDASTPDGMKLLLELIKH